MNESMSNYSINDSFSISTVLDKELTNIINVKEIDLNDINKDYPIRCPICSEISRLNIDLQKISFSTICDNKHKFEYSSFDSFFKNCYKIMGDLICHDCKKSKDECTMLFRCNKCYLFICSECKSKHSKDTNHSNYIELEKIDKYCPKHSELYRYYDTNKKINLCERCKNLIVDQQKENCNNMIETSKFKKFDNLKDYTKKLQENILIWNNIIKITNDWMNNFKKEFNAYLNSINDYIILKYKIVNYLDYNNNYLNYENNYNILYNYDIVTNENLNNYIKSINNSLNNNYNKNDIFASSKFFIDLLNDFSNKGIIMEMSKDISGKESKIISEKNELFKLENMIKMEYEFDSEVTYLAPFDKDKIILGFNSGKIQISEEKMEENNQNSLIQKSSIEAFENGITIICKIDKNLIVSSDNKNITKIIKFESDLNNYSMIQDLNFKENIGKIYSIINLQNFSYYKNRHYFCIGNDNSIIIYKSNKMPEELVVPNLQYHDEIEQYSIAQPSFIIDDNNNLHINEHKNEPLSFIIEKEIVLNTPITCMVEVNEKLICATCPKSKNIKFFQMKNEFKETISFPNISLSEGNCILTLSEDKSKIITACKNGICQIKIDNLKKFNQIHFQREIFCLDFYNNNYLLCTLLKGNNIHIRQYFIKDEIKDIKKKSEYIVNSPNQIKYLKVINNKIYYLDGTNCIHYFQINKKL